MERRFTDFSGWVSTLNVCFIEWGTIDCSMINYADVLIIDEYSMMSAGLLETVHKLLLCNNGYWKEQMFAGKSVFRFGDLFQLPAIENHRYFKTLCGNISKYCLSKTVGSLKI